MLQEIKGFLVPIQGAIRAFGIVSRLSGGFKSVLEGFNGFYMIFRGISRLPNSGIFESIGWI